MDASFCSSQSIGDPRGCFVLSHDKPVKTTSYNTSIDVVDYVENNQYWYQSPFPQKYMALCFKLSSVKACSKSPSANDFIGLVTELVSNLTMVIESNNLGLEVILDGSGAPLDCLMGLWNPLVSTWIGHPWEAIHSNNETLGYNRFQVVDLPIEPIIPGFLIDLMCLESPPFGKFSGPNASYPVLVWEPSNQATIDSVAQSYIDCQLKHSSQSFAPLRYATNIDPAQMLVYQGTQTSRNSWNVRLDSMSPENSKLLEVSPISQIPENYFGSLVVVTEIEQILFTITFFTNQSSVYYYHLLVSKGEFGDLYQSGTFSLPLGDRGQLLYAKMIGNQQLLTYNENSGYILYSLELNNSSLLLDFKPLVFGVLPNDLGASFLSSTLDFINQKTDSNGTQSLEVIQYYSSSTCSFGATTWSIAISPFLEPLSVQGPTCLLSNQSPDFQDINTMSAINSHNPFSPCLYDGIVTFDSTSKQTISGLYVCIKQDLSFNVTSGPSVLDVGGNPQLSMALYNGQPHVLLIHDQGYCYNTETRNKRPSPRVCESTASTDSNSKVLNYAYGLFSDFLIHIEQSLILSACDNTILHGAYDQGSYPSGTLFNTFDYITGNATIGVITLHQGVSSTFIDYSACGAPNSHNDLVLDSWPLYPSLINIDK
ncbi:hypothetical protein PPL_08745 [Heterostelium album PN500]|uniref:Uncharacterized protein n=1 Tax=Heterostelium pallidum (strain ATCC 26659 / Pp 5 / PN500) TaxID=670386 RepID=D3BJL7_HETP5|nr:hypothetical protein PPL_08745 [Heterostelium album PN500]EFA78097.1 hypothetical protein PPL_08745 [Heterostelium album PN500]|eukprot:XP_020430224.1 hypothetical protein PPL_08745 [Heterostelium album PN500]